MNVRRRIGARAVAFGVAAVALLALAIATHEPGARPRGGSLERLLGPFAPLAAAIEWSRFDRALAAGRPELAYERAERALALAPSDASGWKALAHHFVYERASPELEPDRAVRRRWVAIGLDVLDRGETLARDPGAVAFKRGVVYLSLASQSDDARGTTLTSEQCWLAAADAFERAAREGEPLAADAARLSREEARRSAAR